jgi:hypothetical protein
MSDTAARLDGLGWAGPGCDDPEVVALRSHIAANGGIVGMKIVEPHEIERAVHLFDRDGFVVVRDALTPEQTEYLANGVLRAVEKSSRSTGLAAATAARTATPSATGSWPTVNRSAATTTSVPCGATTARPSSPP